VELTRAWEFSLIDCQVTTPHLVSLGAKEVRRPVFLKMLEAAMGAETRIGPWGKDKG